MSNILVTGGAGFIGTHLIKRLLKEGHKVTSLDNYLAGKVENHQEGATYIKGDTNNIHELVGHGGERFDVVFHLGEYSRIAPSFDDIKTVWDCNSNGNFKVLEFCRQNNIKIVYAGSSTKFAAEGPNHSPYSFTKAKAADLVKNYHTWYGLRYAICYFYNVFGEGYDSAPVAGYESVISVFEKQYKAGKPLTICGTGHHRRAFTFVDDIVDGLIKSWYYPDCEEFQLNNPKEYSILEIAKMFGGEIIHLPDRRGDRSTSATTNNNARELLNWEATMDITEWIKNIKDDT